MISAWLMIKRVGKCSHFPTLQKGPEFYQGIRIS